MDTCQKGQVIFIKGMWYKTGENHKEGGMMRRIVLILVLLLLAISATGWAASFDCGKAQLKVEKLVCDTPAISKLDDELGKLYQEAINKANEKQKQLLITEQKHWLKHTRNVCRDETCLKLAYWSRQAELATFFEPKSPLYKHEADKTEAIKQVLATAPLYPSESSDTPFCRQMFDDLKQVKGVRFVDPVVQTQSYEDPALDKWKQHCEAKPPLHFSYSCLPNVSGSIRNYKDALETPGCYKGFGLPPFKLYELPPEEPTGRPRTILYADDNFGSEVWEYNDILANDWERIKPKPGRGGFAGFQQIDTKQCARISDVFSDAGGGDRNGKNFNSIIEYKKQYYFLVLHKPPLSNKYWLYADTVTPNGAKNQKYCRWTPVAPKPNSSNQGRK